MTSVGDVLALANAVHQLCQTVGAAKSMVRVCGRKIEVILPVLGRMRSDERDAGLRPSPEAIRVLDDLERDLREMKEAVRRADRMGRVAFIVRARSVHDELQGLLGRIHLSIAALQAGTSDEVRRELRTFHHTWRSREDEIRQEVERLREDRVKIMMAVGDFSGGMNIADAASLKSRVEMEDAVRQLERERDVLRKERRDLSESLDSVAASKAAAEEDAMNQIIAAIRMAEARESQSTRDAALDNIPPSWICPVISEVMFDPVIVDSYSCKCTCSRRAAEEWFKGSNKTCPVCGSDLQSSTLLPNVPLRDTIEYLHVRSKKTTPTAGQIVTEVPGLERHKKVIPASNNTTGWDITFDGFPFDAPEDSTSEVPHRLAPPRSFIPKLAPPRSGVQGYTRAYKAFSTTVDSNCNISVTRANVGLENGVGRSNQARMAKVCTADKSGGIDIRAGFCRNDGKIAMKLELANISCVAPLTSLAIQLNKNAFGLSPASQQITCYPPIPQGSTGRSTVELIHTDAMVAPVQAGRQAVSQVQVAVKNMSTGKIFYFAVDFNLDALFTDDGDLGPSAFIDAWKSIDDSKEVYGTVLDLPLASTDIESVQLKFLNHNIFFIARRPVPNAEGQEVVYFSMRTATGMQFLAELTFKRGVNACKICIKTESTAYSLLAKAALENLLRD